MDLCSLTIAGFRRFSVKQTLKTNGKLVALLGPNEAGKSSLLHAISLLDHDDAPDAGDFARGDDPENFLIEGRFFLSPEDIQAAGLTTSRWLRVVKKADGQRKYGIDPLPPKRDLSARRKLGEHLELAAENSKFRPRAEALDLLDGFDEVMGYLRSDAEDLKASAIEKTVSFANGLVGIIDDRDVAAVRRLPKLIKGFEAAETALNPGAFARKTLHARLPNILVFDEDARALASEYDLAELSASVPAALSNVCQIADLDLQALLTAHGKNATPTITTLEHGANERLKERFKEDWQQSGLSVSLRVQNGRLAVQVVNKRYEFTSFAERSDGLRQFVALQAFATGKRDGSSILLVDEADQKLHYDAQADLVQMLARQELAAKVIYTTHSAGCLPEDLGNGVRFARPRTQDETRSEIENKFWAENDSGFAPLLIGMGASTLAFFPTRHAVMVEGPADMLLLPTMFREALSANVLGFQFVPGLSCAEDETVVHAPAIGKGAGILYLVDSDPGGEELKSRLLKRGVTKENVFSLKNKDGSAKEVEDFLDANILIQAANSILEKWHDGVPKFTLSDIKERDRMSALGKLFLIKTKSKLSKIDLAYEILDIVSDNPGQTILAKDRKAALKSVASAIIKNFESKSKPKKA